VMVVVAVVVTVMVDVLVGIEVTVEVIVEVIVEEIEMTEGVTAVVMEGETAEVVEVVDEEAVVVVRVAAGVVEIGTMAEVVSEVVVVDVVGHRGIKNKHQRSNVAAAEITTKIISPISSKTECQYN